MSWLFNIVDPLFILSGFTIILFAGLQAVRNNMGGPAWLLLVGGAVSLLMYASTIFNIPEPPLFPTSGIADSDTAYVIYSESMGVLEAFSAVRRILLTSGHCIMALGILGLVRRANT